MATDELSDVGVTKGSVTGADGALWGFASISLGGIAVLIAPIILLWNVIVAQTLIVAQRRPSGPLVGVYAILMLFGIATMLGLAGVSIGFGLKGRRIDHGNRRDSPLATAGLLLGVASGIGWFMVSVQTFLILFT